jgi:outer membrane biosynthesis protein TonB
MALPDQTPKLPKWPFLLGDAALLGAAWLIAERAPRPLAGNAVAAIVFCATIAALAGAIPFLSDYARKQDESLDERQRSLEALARTVATASEQIGIAAVGFQEITALAEKNLKQAELLSQRFREEIPALQARLEEFDPKIAALKSAAAKLSAPPAPKPAKSAPPEAKPTEPPVAPPPAPGPESVAPPTPSPPPEPEPVQAVPPPEAVPAAPPARKRAPKKVAEPVEPALPLALDPAPQESEFSQLAPEDAAESAVSADGAARLLVTAYIGIGNRLYIRGDGPGLNWDKGVPLQFVSIGKWSWETAEAAEHFSFKLYKNDELECAAIGLRRLEPGRQQELTATF